MLADIVNKLKGYVESQTSDWEGVTVHYALLGSCILTRDQKECHLAFGGKIESYIVSGGKNYPHSFPAEGIEKHVKQLILAGIMGTQYTSAFETTSDFAVSFKTVSRDVFEQEAKRLQELFGKPDREEHLFSPYKQHNIH